MHELSDTLINLSVLQIIKVEQRVFIWVISLHFFLIQIELQQEMRRSTTGMEDMYRLQ